jgi:serine/threonine protein phosphatase PrpC
MDFLRRVLGLSTASGTTSRNETITITHGNDTPPSPPEPKIETPTPGAKRSEKAGSASAPEPERVVVPAAAAETITLAGTRPLPPLEAVVPKPGQRLTFGALSDVGMVRGNNQDAMFTMVASSLSADGMPDFGLFMVADGMGGHHDGEKASAITLRIVARYVMNEILGAMLDQQMNDPDRPSMAETLRAAIEKANEAVTEEIPEGGTTVTATVVLGDLAYIAHVGDSRAYMITDDGIEQVTRDHSLVQRLIELDQLTPEEAAEHPQRNVLYRAIGQSDTLDVDAITRRLAPRARLLLCSDGLWNLVSEETIREIVSGNSPQEACGKLVQMANERGGPDNITVILVQVPG